MTFRSTEQLSFDHQDLKWQMKDNVRGRMNDISNVEEILF